MIDVVLDTSVFVRDPGRRKAAFRALERLAKTRLLRLHVPEVVRMEVVTRLRAELDEVLAEIEAGIKRFKRRVSLAQERRLDEADGIVRELRVDVDASVALQGWLKEVGAHIYEISEGTGAAVMTSYFAGDAPFARPKKRDDIPDAFIWRNVVEIAEVCEHVHFVCLDSRLRECADGQTAVTAYGSLDDFIGSPECQGLLREEHAEENLARLADELPGLAHSLTERVAGALSGQLQDKVFISSEIPEDNHEARISGVYERLDGFELDGDALEDYGGGVIVVPFRANVECSLNYCIYIADYYLLPDEEQKRISVSEWNDHYCDAEEDRMLEVEGVLELCIDEDKLGEELDAKELRGLIVDADVSIDSIESIRVAGEGPER